MLKIRLQRIGKKGQAYFRVIVTEHTQKPKGRFLELLGNYDPHKNIVNVKKERVEYWVSKGAQFSPTVNNLLVGRGIVKGEKVRVWKPKSKPSKSEISELPKLQTEVVIPLKEIKKSADKPENKEETATAQEV